MFLGRMSPLGVRCRAAVPNQSIGIVRQYGFTHPACKFTSIRSSVGPVLPNFVKVVRQATRADDENAAVAQRSQRATKSPRASRVEVVRHRYLKDGHLGIGKQMQHGDPYAVVQASFRIFVDKKTLRGEQPSRLRGQRRCTWSRILQSVQLRRKSAKVVKGLGRNGSHHPRATTLPVGRHHQRCLHVGYPGSQSP